MDKAITFAIAAYNSEGFLEKCLRSFLCEAVLDKIEVLVINDGSTDGTERIGKVFEAQYPGVFRVISKENGGHGSAINTGAREARGKYFKVIDADDWVETHNLPMYLETLEQVDADVVVSHYKTFDVSSGDIVDWKLNVPDYHRTYSLKDVAADWKLMEAGLTFHGITYRTSFYRQFGIQLVEKVFYEDHQFATIPCCYADSIYAVDLCVYVYRIGDVNQSVSAMNQYRRKSHLQTVIRQMAADYAQQSGNMKPEGRDYYLEKLRVCLLSYFVTMLLVATDKQEGRAETKAFYGEMETVIPAVCSRIRKKYNLLRVLNLLHVKHSLYLKMIELKNGRNR